ncbi:MAG: glutamate-5-semialdehyde dehydrogenase [Eggerthellaceae bacterium]|nr:glutamate-5-semialdehyde dehydrogenase [Eggerthellaceae bacterium]
MEQMSEVMRIALQAREAAKGLGLLSSAQRDAILLAMADALETQQERLLSANAQDMEAARAKGTPAPLLDRLMLDAKRIAGIANALRDLAALSDPLAGVLEERVLYNGIKLRKVPVPLGVVGMIYEARPNVTADAAGLCIKTGNACILRGGSLALRSNLSMAKVLEDAAVAAGAPVNCIQAISDPSHAATDELMTLHGLVDVLIPRGGAGLIQHCVMNSKVPVIETGVGNCHTYVHASADQDMALSIIRNAKCSRPGVCNACESVLVDEAIAGAFLPRLIDMLLAQGVVIHGDERVIAAAGDAANRIIPATTDDWAREYLDLEISIHVIAGIQEAIDHVNRYGTKHSECIVAADQAACEAFLTQIDAAAVYANCSTRFTDGGEFGLGAEIGISTQKLHARGPMGLQAMTSYKYQLQGEGQIR